jgi:hypothetical protein
VCRYPYNLDFDSYKALEGLSRFSINNLGDPFIESNYGVHSRPFEVTNHLLQVMIIAMCDWLLDVKDYSVKWTLAMAAVVLFAADLV